MAVKHYKNKAGQVFKRGVRVTLAYKALAWYKRNEGETFAGVEIDTTRVDGVYHEHKGLVHLRQRLGGYWTWHVDELRVV